MYILRQSVDCIKLLHDSKSEYSNACCIVIELIQGSKSSKGRYHYSTNTSNHFKPLPMARVEEYPPYHYTSM